MGLLTNVGLAHAAGVGGSLAAVRDAKAEAPFPNLRIFLPCRHRLLQHWQ